MPYKNIEDRRKNAREYMRKHPQVLTEEQKERKRKYMREYLRRNKDKLKEYQAYRYKRDKEKIALRQKEYRCRNREKLKAAKHEYYLANRDYFAEKSKKYYLENLPQIRSYKNEYRKTPKGKWFVYQHSAKRRGHEFQLTQEQFFKIISDGCHYCGTSQNIGIDRKDSSIGYTTENCVPCCENCNFMKRSMSYQDFFVHLKKIIENLKH